MNPRILKYPLHPSEIKSFCCNLALMDVATNPSTSIKRKYASEWTVSLQIIYACLCVCVCIHMQNGQVDKTKSACCSLAYSGAPCVSWTCAKCYGIYTSSTTNALIYFEHSMATAYVKKHPFLEVWRCVCTRTHLHMYLEVLRWNINSFWYRTLALKEYILIWYVLIMWNVFTC